MTRSSWSYTRRTQRAQVSGRDARPLLNDSGVSQGAVTVYRDITGHKQAERSLRESEERFHSFMDNSPSCAWMKNDAGRYVYINQALRDLLQLTDDQVLGKTDHELGLQHADEYRRNDLAILESGVPRQVAENYDLANGDRRRFLDTKFRFIDRSNRSFVGGIGIDDTERYRAEEALKEQTRLLQLILDQMGDGVAVHGPRGEWILTNPATQRAVGGALDGKSLDEVLGSGMLYQGDGTTPLRADESPAMRALRGESVNDVEVVVRGPTRDSEACYSVSARPMIGDDQSLQGVVIVSRDLTRASWSKAVCARARLASEAFLRTLPRGW